MQGRKDSVELTGKPGKQRLSLDRCQTGELKSSDKEQHFDTERPFLSLTASPVSTLFSSNLSLPCPLFQRTTSGAILKTLSGD